MLEKKGLRPHHPCTGASQVALVVRNLPANAGDKRDARLTPGWEDPLEEEMATQPSIPVWEIPWTEKLGGLQSMVLQRVSTTEAT